MGKFIVLIGIMSVTLAGGFATFVGQPVNATYENADFSRKVNLALRRTAHQLLRRAGDATSRIEPVKQLDTRTFVVRLNRSFDYNRLPQLLKASFQQHAIQGDYDVAVLDCAKGELQLGYNVQDLLKPDGVACGGRKQVEGCYTLQVTFNKPEPVKSLPLLGWGVGIGTVLLGLGYVFWRKTARSSDSSISPETASTEPEPEGLIRLGQSTFEPNSLVLKAGGQAHNLTYREAKLLRFFLQQPNQVIERDAILKAVWEDEGITVGRSVDVFVSRLRKLLQNDPTLRLVAVHGVGYRLEVRTQPDSVSDLRNA
ncbi:hypothetical protein GCM10028807_39040 [Spirosoma daeguense]